MTKFRKSILIFGILVFIIAAALGTFIVLSLTGSLKTEGIELEFTVDYAEKEYDGEPLMASSFQITAGFPVEGHTPVVTFTGGQTEVGEGLSGLEVKMVNEKGYDVTREYDIRVNPGVLSVYKCPLRVALTAHDITYDGTMVDIGDGYTVTGGKLVKGHRVMMQIKDEWFAVAGTTVAGETLTAGDLDLYILDANGRNVTGNYSVAPPTGRVNIVRRPLEISPVSVEKAYDGKPLTCSQYKIESGSLASGQYVVAEYSGANGGSAEVTDVNTNSPLEVVVVPKIYDINGYDVTDNYTILTKIGYVTVNKAPLTLTLSPIEKEYGDGFDGEELEDLYSITTTVKTLTLKFPTDDYLENFFKSLTDRIGNTTYTFGDFAILDVAKELKDVTDMFNITVAAGNIRVSPRKVSFKDRTLSKTYDGTLTFTENLPELDKIVEGHSVASVSVTPSGSYGANEQFSAKIKSVSLIDEQGNDVRDNYKITDFDDAVNVSVSCRDILIKSSTLEKPYDGTPLSGGNLTYDSIADGDRLVYTPFEITYVSESGLNMPTDIRILNGKGEDVTEFYLGIEDGDYGLLTITQRMLGITLSPIYGTPNNGDNLTGIIIWSGLADNDVIKYNDPYSVVWAQNNMSGLNAEYASAISVLRNGEDVTDNYIFPPAEEVPYGTVYPN